MGRRTLLNQARKDIIIKYISNGNYLKTACMAAGISEQTFYNWLHRAEVGGDNGNKIYVEFFEELKRAEAKSIAKNVETIQKASKNVNQWSAAAWLLERKYPADFGRRVELEVGPSKVLLALQEQARQLSGGDVIEGEVKDV